MSDKAEKNPKKLVLDHEQVRRLDAPSGALLIDEFEIIELEDRLELAGRCNNRCATQ